MLQANQTKKKPQKSVFDSVEIDNPVKAIKNVGESVVKSATTASQDAVKDMWSQILGSGKYEGTAKPKPKMSGDLTPGQAVDLKSQEKKPAPRAEAPMSYFREVAEAGKTGLYKEQQQVRQDVQAIVYELKRLASSSKALQREVSVAAGPAQMANPGKYHVSFFEWMLLVVKDARQKVENAGAWLHTVKSKKRQAIGGMKKNMSQLMSGERSVSNQTA